MDGTGELFAPFVREFGAITQIVRYPSSESGYTELEAFVRRELPGDDEFFLLGESFSGPVSIAIAADPPPNLKGLVLCCTFATTPHPLLAPFRHLLPLLPAPPLRVLEALLCGRFANAEVRSLLKHALAQVPLRVLKARARAAATANVMSKLRAIRKPVLCLSASEDRVVPKATLRKLVENVREVRNLELVAPHFLLQTAAQQAAAVITEFMAEGSRAT
jgi:pimeloyl-ACP methyl ester carboxylesterase